MKDGLSEAHHLQALADRGVKAAQEMLEGPDYPDVLDYLWNWFRELDLHRSTSAMEGSGPITFEQLDAWTRLTRRTPQAHEVEALMRLDEAIRFPPPP
jgi:hypothetical protein